MAGCKPLSDSEIDLILKSFSGPFALRNKVLFMLGLSTGFRISELLSIKIDDVVNPDGTVKDYVQVHRRNTKGKIKSRSTPLLKYVHTDLTNLVLSLFVQNKKYLFSSRQGSEAVSASQGWRIITQVLFSARIFETGTHRMRKTFAQKIYEATQKNIYETQKALGHKSIDSTTSYLQFDREDLDLKINNLF